MRFARRKQSGLDDHAGHGVIESLLQPAAGIEQRGQVDAGVESHAMQHVDEVFGGNVARGCRRERTTADAAAARVQRAHAGLDRGVGIGETGVAGVVEVRAQFHARQRRRAAAPTSSVTCVGTATPMVSAIGDFVGIARRQPFRERRSRASAATSPSKGQPKAVEIVICARIPASRAASAMSSQAVDALFDAAALVALAEGFAGGDGHAHLGASRRVRAIESLAVQHQADVTRAGALLGASAASTSSASAICGTRLGFTKLATSMRRRPARRQAADEFDLRGRRQHLRFALQAIARPDFHDLDVLPIPWREFYPWVACHA